MGVHIIPITIPIIRIMRLSVADILLRKKVIIVERLAFMIMTTTAIMNADILNIIMEEGMIGVMIEADILLKIGPVKTS